MAVDFKVIIPYDYAIIDSQENLMGQVFTSYSRRDTETVDNFVGKLRQAWVLGLTEQELLNEIDTI